jgi:iron complex outermembrane receptor protein
MNLQQMVLTGCAAAAIAGGSAVARAQEAPQGTGGAGSMAPSVGDIVVTARRVEERLQDIPVAVSALNAEQLTQRGIREIRDLNATVPNVSIQQANTGAGAVFVTVRGLGLEAILLTYDPSVGVYVDGINVPRPYGLRAAMVDIERVEVLRGPQGTLYGKNTTGGAISFYTADPTPEFGANGELTFGNYGAFGGNAVLNMPLTDDLSARFVGARTRHDPYNISSVTGAGSAEDDSWYGRAKFKYSGEKLTAVLSGEITEMETGAPSIRFRAPTVFNGPASAGGNSGLIEVAIASGIAPSASSWSDLTQAQRDAAFNLLNKQITSDFYRNNSAFTGNRQSFSGRSAGLDLTYEIDDYLTLRSITGYRHFETVNATDGDGTIFVLNESRLPTRSSFFSQEVQLIGGGRKLNWVAGLYYSHEDGNLTEISRTTPLRNINRGRDLITVSDVDIVSKSVGVFAQANLHLTDRLTLTGGARWTKETKETVLHNGSFSGPGNATLTGNLGTFTCGVAINGVTLPADDCSRQERDSFEKPTWLASLDYKITPDVLIYAKLATGFKGGGQQTRVSGTVEAAYQGFAPETVREIEFGLKSEFLDRKVRLNLALFHDKYEDIQKSLFVVPPVTRIANATGAVLKGVEAELTVIPTPGLTLTANGGYLDAKYNKDEDPACISPFQTGCFFGQAWPAPKWNYSLGAQYSLPTSVGELTTTLNWVWQDDLVLSPENPEFKINATQKAYGLLSGRIAMKVDAWDAEVALFGRNLLDKEYYSTAINFSGLGFMTGYTGEPRTYGLQFIKRFGQF